MYLTREEMGNMPSGDYSGQRIRKVLPAMRKYSKIRSAQSGNYRGARDVDQYLGDMQDAAAQVGGIVHPVLIGLKDDHVENSDLPGERRLSGPFVADGTHRGLTAYQHGYLTPAQYSETPYRDMREGRS
jgi:hypothetical protein